QRVERASSQPSNAPAATIQPADDHDSAGGSSFDPAGSAPPLSGSAAPTSAGGVFGVPDSTVPTSAAMDSAGSHRESGVSPFADSADSSSPSPVSTDHIPIDVLFEPTSGGINEFFLDSDEDEQIGMSRVAADPDSDDEVLAEILFRGQYISGAGVVVVDKLPDDEIVDPRVKVETVSDYASSPPRSRRKRRGVRSDDFLWDKPVEDFFSSESESDDDMETYIPPLPYGAFKDWEIVRCPLSTTYYHVYYQENRRQKSFFYLKQLLPHVYREDLLLLRRRMNRYFRLNPDVDVGLDLWRDVNLLCQSLHSDDVEDFWRTQDEWVVSSWKLYPKSSVHVLDLTNGKTVYMFVDKIYPIRATLLERMLRHKLTVPPSYCRDVVVAGNVIQTVQTSLRQSFECLASAPFACTARQMVFSSPWLTAKKESGSSLQTALVCNSNPLIAVKTFSNPLYGCDGLPKTVRVFQFTLDSRSEKLDWLLLHQDWKLLLRDVAASFDSAVHRVHAGSFDAAVASLVSAACVAAAAYFVPAMFASADSIKSFLLAVQVTFLLIMFLLVMFSFLLTEIESADYNMANENVPAPAPTRSDDQILLFVAWVPIGKSNYVLDLQKKQKNPIFQISVDILQNTNFFRAFIAPASVPSIYIQQFWNTLTYVEKTGAYRFQLDEDCPAKKGKETKPHVIPYCRKSLTGNLKFVPKGEDDEVFGMQIPKELIIDDIRKAPYYKAYLDMVAKHDHKIAA
ncbi:hypothetical protein Tco_1242783, partial [Tanacetum coccineum]